jgi:predicted SAM-dependent methyltransferase
MKTLKLNLGCGKVIMKGWINLDKFEHPGVDVIRNLETDRLPFADGSIDEILADNVFEHIRDWHLNTWEECSRVLKKGGIFTIIVPCGYDGNPLHVSEFFPNTIPYWVGPHPENRSLEVLDKEKRTFNVIEQTLTRWSSVPFAYYLKKYLPIPRDWFTGSKPRRFGKPHMVKWVLKKC